ncbi:MAG: hypothetical protein QME96_08975 [Myxococcota bacterium]|nr:hypothetical protein [Myxococcota bacterium]
MRCVSRFVAAALAMSCCLLLGRCSLLGSCSSGARVSDADDGPACTFSTCEEECRVRGLCYGSCGGGRCNCTECSPPGDAGHEDGADDSSDHADSTPPDCDVRGTGETRAGAAPAVVCVRVSVPTNEEALLRFDAGGSSIVFVADQGDGDYLWLYDRQTRCTRVLDDFGDTEMGYAYGHDPSIEDSRVAYVATWATGVGDTRTRILQLRLLDIESRNKRVLVETRSTMERDRSGGMDFVTLRYPWIVWSDERESNWYRWDAYAFNIDTGEERNLSVDPATGERQWGSVVRVDLLGTLAVFDSDWGGGRNPLYEEVVSVDLASGDRRQITTSAGSQWNPTITPRWIAWLDQRDYPSCVGGEVCSTDVWGLDRSTGVERALVVAGNSMQGRELDGEGDWLVYEDQRDGTDVTRETDREQEIYALHLPTMTEVRITDWPGYEMLPRAYARGDGSFGVLFVEEISYAPAIYRLWDCDLPTPAGSG